MVQKIIDNFIASKYIINVKLIYKNPQYTTHWFDDLRPFVGSKRDLSFDVK